MAANEKFLILNVEPGNVSALFLDFNEQRELIFEKISEHIDLRTFLKSQARSISQRSWEGNYFLNSRRRLVVLADATLATTIPVPLDFKRETTQASAPITEDEMDDWLHRSMAKIFARCRLEAGRRLGTGEIDTVLVGQRIGRVTVDGHVVSDLVGRSGKKVSFVTDLTFSNRELSEMLLPFFNAPGEFFFAEGPQARLAALARVRALPVNMIVARDGGKSSLFVFEEAEEGCPVVYHEPFPWDPAAVVRQIAVDLGVDQISAEDIYTMYVYGEVSESVKKRLDTIADPSAKRFLQAIDKANLRGSVYLDVPRGLPFPLPHRRGKAIIEDFPTEEILLKFGFSARGGRHITQHVALRYLAPFFELYFDNNRSELNERLRRKLHWLA
ncbi:MAG: hypothetical protein WCF77_01960 [Minisyncoccia bacterium]